MTAWAAPAMIPPTKNRGWTPNQQTGSFMTFHSARSWLLTSACLVIATVPAAAQSAALNTTGALETVVVTGNLESQIPAMLSQNGTQVDTIQAKAIKNGGYVDAAQALADQAPGLYLNEGRGPFDYVNVSYQGSRTPGCAVGGGRRAHQQPALCWHDPAGHNSRQHD